MASVRTQSARISDDDVISASDVLLYELRHFYASGLIANGCDVVTVQRAMGHANATTTRSGDAEGSASVTKRPARAPLQHEHRGDQQNDQHRDTDHDKRGTHRANWRWPCCWGHSERGGR